MVTRPPSVSERIKDQMATLTHSEKRAAHTLLGYYPMAGLESVTQFAKRAGVGAATILRLLGKLGFSAYSDFQEALRAELAARVQSPLWRVAEHPPRSADDLLAGFVDRLTETLRQTLAHLPREGAAGGDARPRSPPCFDYWWAVYPCAGSIFGGHFAHHASACAFG